MMNNKTLHWKNVTNERGFTLIELILVIVVLGILISTAAQKMYSLADDAEINAENTTIETMRKNLTANYGEDLVKGRAARFPDNPFANLSKVPDGYDRMRTTRPTGEQIDDGLWTFVQGAGSLNLTLQQAGTTLATFNPTGIIYHQRRDHSIIKWAYDSTQGIISYKVTESQSDLKKDLDTQKQQRGEETEAERLRRTQKQGF
jgi:MSHA pilin protein MshA